MYVRRSKANNITCCFLVLLLLWLWARISFPQWMLPLKGAVPVVVVEDQPRLRHILDPVAATALDAHGHLRSESLRYECVEGERK